MGWGFNSRMDNIQAAVLNLKFKYYPWILKRRRQIGMMYNKGLKGLPITLPIQQPEQVYQEFIIQVPERKQEFMKHMEKCGVELLVRDTVPNHKLLGLNLSHFSLPITEYMANKVVRLPTTPEMTDKAVRYVIKSIRKFYE